MKQNFYRIYTLFVAMLLSVCLAGCIQEEFAPGGNIAAGVTINYSFDALQTRSIAATPAEKIVNDVYFIFYNVSTNAYVAWQRASIPSGGGGAGSFSLPIPESLTTGSKYRTLIVANYDSYKADGKTFDVYISENRGKSYDEMRRVMRSQSSGRARVTTPLPMYGTLLGTDGEESLFTAPDPSSTTLLPVSVRFSRGVSRFDLHNMAADRLHIAWVKVCNYRDAGYFFHQDVPLGDAVIKGTATGVPPTDLNNLPAGYVKADPPIPGTNRQDLNGGGLYAYPNIVSYVAQDDEYTTCLLIAGYYQKEGEAPNTTKLTFYRANIADTGLSQVLKRNFVYTVVINSVKKEGAGTEDEAVAEKDRLLDYVVDDQWQDDGGGTVTDDKGNFLTISRTSVILDAPANEAAIVKVSVKEGLSWILTWRDPAQTAFKYEKIDNSSFRIITLGTNDTNFLNTALLDIEATGGTVSPSTHPLKVTVNVTQLSSKTELKMLTVEGQTGTLNIDVPGQGSTLKLLVITGGAEAQWQAVPQLDLDFVDSYTQIGTNKAILEVKFPPYITNSDIPRSGTLKVFRNPADGVDPVTIRFSQVKSPYFVSVYPNYGDTNPLVIEGFSDATGNPNGIADHVSFWVTLADPDKYTWSVVTNFRKDADAYLTVGTPDDSRTASYTANPAKDSLRQDEGAQFNLHVFRTGPGDDDIHGSVVIWAEPNAGTDLPKHSIGFPVVIRTSCALGGDVIIGDKIVADRNYGTPTKLSGAIKALNYTTVAYHPDVKNTIWKGAIYGPNRAADICKIYGKENYIGTDAEGWVQLTGLPNNTVQRSKQRLYIWQLCEDGSRRGAYVPYVGETYYGGTGDRRFAGTRYNVTSAHVSSLTYRYGGLDMNLKTVSGQNSVPDDKSAVGFVRCMRIVK